MQNIRMMRRREVESITGLGRSAIYEKMAEGTFPKNVPLGLRAVGWVSSEVESWVADRIDQARSQTAA